MYRTKIAEVVLLVLTAFSAALTALMVVGGIVAGAANAQSANDPVAPVCITAEEYLTTRYEDLHGRPIPAPGDYPGMFELKQWRFNHAESFYFVDKDDLPFQAERFSFYATKGGKTMIIAAYWSGCLVAAVEVPAAQAAQLMLEIKGLGLGRE